MLEPGEYADALRVVGRWLEQQGVDDVEVTDEGQYLSVSWAGTYSGQRQFRAFELAQLRREARLLRAIPQGTPSIGIAEMLRTLGGELDRSSLELLSITQIPGGFRLSATAAGRRTSTDYPLAEIHRMIVAQRAERGGGAPEQGSAPVTSAPAPATPSVPPSAALAPAVGLGLRARIRARGNR